MLKHIKTSEPVSNSLGSQSVPSVSDYAEMDSVPKSHQDDVLDLSSLGFSHTPPTEATSELPLNEESMNLMEVAELDTCIHLDGLPEIPAKLVSFWCYKLFSCTHTHIIDLYGWYTVLINLYGCLFILSKI